MGLTLVLKRRNRYIQKQKNNQNEKFRDFIFILKVGTDFIIEIVSPSNAAEDYIRKLYYYKTFGVREYWIVDSRRKIVTVNDFEKDILNIQYFFDSSIKVNIYDDLFINFSDIANILNT